MLIGFPEHGSVTSVCYRRVNLSPPLFNYTAIMGQGSESCLRLPVYTMGLQWQLLHRAVCGICACVFVCVVGLVYDVPCHSPCGDADST